MLEIANMIILIILIIVLLLSFLFINKTLKKKDNILEDVKLQENTIKNDGFALMLQQSDGTYKESTSSSWPTDMVFNAELSGCIDTDGNKIENSLSFDKVNNVVNVSVGKTAYCYVYFDKEYALSKLCSGSSLGSCLANNESKINDLWNSPLEDGGYRYVGTDPNNYICFGTNDKDKCINDTDKYMYRIIGIFEDSSGNKHVKLIKKEALNTAYAWHSNYQTDVEWNNSDLYKGLNGSYFLTNSNYSYMQGDWSNKISTWNYTLTNTKTYDNGPDYMYITTKNIYLHELNKSGKTSSIGEWKTLSTKIGLMYASDYALSLGNKAIDYVGIDNKSEMKTGWMHLSNNDTSSPSASEWTMSRGDVYSGIYIAWLVHSDGYVYFNNVSTAYSIRPVFYLNSNEKYVSGEGTKEDPIMLVDDQAPTITSLYYYDNTSPKPYLKITTNEDATYCINANASASNFDNCVLQGSLKANTETSTGYFTTSGDYYLHVKDADGNSNVEQLGWIEVSIYIGDYILKYEPSGFYAAMEGGLYRFKGTVDDVNNYICYGTSSKSECLNDTDKYMYRIIGINSSKQLKLIKNEALNTKYQWNSTYTSLVTWPNSTIYGTITGSSYLTGNTYMDSSWKLKIVSTNWKYGTLTTNNATASSIYSSENSWTSTQTSQVGLMYLSDYYYSYQVGGLNCAYGQDYSKCKNSWLHISNCDSSAPSTSEWTMSQRGNDGSGSYAGYTIGSGGYSSEAYYAGSYSIRPVFYIEYAINYFGGIGTAEDPFRLY